jgi:hypothetical protein
MTISDEAASRSGGSTCRRAWVYGRVAWNLRAEAPAEGADGREGAGRKGEGGEEQAGRGGAGAQGGGRGGPPQGPLVAPGRYRAQLGKQVGTDVTALGQSQTFLVVPLDR